MSTPAEVPKYGVRRFITRAARGDERCFELYEIATGKCVSFPGTRKSLEKYARERNAAASAPTKDTP